MPRQPPAVMAPAESLTSYPARSIAGSASRPINVTTAPTMPVAVANTAQVTMVATASEAGHVLHGELHRAKQLVDDVGALDDVAHEDEERNRDQHVVRHHAPGPLHHEVEDRVLENRLAGLVERIEAEDHAQSHQRKGGGKAEHDRHHDEPQHQETDVAVRDLVGREEDTRDAGDHDPERDEADRHRAFQRSSPRRPWGRDGSARFGGSPSV